MNFWICFPLQNYIYMIPPGQAIVGGVMNALFGDWNKKKSYVWNKNKKKIHLSVWCYDFLPSSNIYEHMIPRVLWIQLVKTELEK